MAQRATTGLSAQLTRVAPDTDLAAALEAMDDANVAQMPVIDANARIVGVVSREQVLHYLGARAELGV